MKIPVPENGYWSKTSFGKPVIRLDLPLDYNGVNEVSFNQITEFGIKTKIDLVYKVPNKLTNPDPLIISAKKELETSTYSYDGVKTTKRGELNIRVSPKNVDRALRIFDTIIKIFRARHYEIVLKSEAPHVIIDTIDFEISLREKLNHEKPPSGSYSSGTYTPSGELIFKFEHRWLIRKEWSDTKNKLLEDKLLNIMDDLELKAKDEKERHLEIERSHKEEVKKEKIVKELEVRNESELNNFKLLLKQAHQWHKAIILENYIAEFEKKALEKGHLTDEIKGWIAWAKQKAEWFNPLIQGEDSILSDEDRQDIL
jgi:predicted transposase YbfD/YdcC